MSARPMTPTERARYEKVFPDLVHNVPQDKVTDGATLDYNCIAWTVGDTKNWLWPGNRLDDFNAFYALLGYIPSKSGTIAVWNKSDGMMSHGCKSFDTIWESKCGGGLRILHTLPELTGVVYGSVIQYYDKDPKWVETVNDNKFISLTTSENQIIAKHAKAVGAELTGQFRAAFAAWKQTWSSPEHEFDSSPDSRASGDDFQRLTSLGDATLPLVIQELTKPENFFALSLYEFLQTDESLKVPIKPDDPTVLQGEQGRAQRTVRTWIKNERALPVPPASELEPFKAGMAVATLGVWFSQAVVLSISLWRSGVTWQGLLAILVGVSGAVAATSIVWRPRLNTAHRTGNLRPK